MLVGAITDRVKALKIIEAAIAVSSSQPFWYIIGSMQMSD